MLLLDQRGTGRSTPLTARAAARFPDDARRLRRIADLLAAQDVRLPDGDRLTVRRLRTLGLVLGTGEGFERLHAFLDEAQDGDAALTDTFLYQVPWP